MIQSSQLLTICLLAKGMCVCEKSVLILWFQFPRRQNMPKLVFQRSQTTKRDQPTLHPSNHIPWSWATPPPSRLRAIPRLLSPFPHRRRPRLKAHAPGRRPRRASLEAPGCGWWRWLAMAGGGWLWVGNDGDSMVEPVVNGGELLVVKAGKWLIRTIMMVNEWLIIGYNEW